MSTEKDFIYEYQLLDRLRQDCEYYLGNGNKNSKYLWTGNELEQIEKMRELYNKFPDDLKPEWITIDDINKYEEKMLSKEEIQINKINAKNDIKKLDKLYRDILNINCEDKEIITMLGKISDEVSKNIKRIMQESNISYNEYIKLCEESKKQNRREELLLKLGEDKLNSIFELNNIKEIVEILDSYEFTKEEILEQFADEEDIEEVRKILEENENLIEDISTAYRNYHQNYSKDEEEDLEDFLIY